MKCIFTVQQISCNNLHALSKYQHKPQGVTFSCSPCIFVLYWSLSTLWCEQRHVIERPSPSPAADTPTPDSADGVYDMKELDQLKDLLLQRDNEIGILDVNIHSCTLHVLSISTVCSTLRWAVLTVLWILFCHTGPISLYVDWFICVYLCVFCVFLFYTA